MRRRLTPTFAGALLAALLVPFAHSFPLDPVELEVVREQKVLSYPVRDLAGNLLRMQAWRIVEGTGNCCENHVATTPDGRILDLGGDSLYVGTQDGTSWTRIMTGVHVSGEGSVAVAPNGDIVGVIWDPYSGDRMTALKQDARTGKWDSMLVALHRPFFDRPWVTLVTGPVEFAGVEAPYAVVARSGYIEHGSALVSIDGLHYLPSARRLVATTIVDPTPILQPAVAWADWVQAPGHSLMTPLPGGGALATDGCPWERLGTDLAWQCARPPSATSGSPKAVRFDSLGRLHTLHALSDDRLMYRVSLDGGATLRSHVLPKFGSDIGSRAYDLVVNGATDVTHIALLYTKSDTTEQVAIIRIGAPATSTPSIEVMEVGLGDVALGNGITGSMRMDFVSLATLPDGRVVTSFADSLHHPPHIAIEMP